MKTIYMKPELTVVNINKPCLLAGSIPEGEEYKQGNTVLAKGGGFWDDEEEEDYGW